MSYSFLGNVLSEYLYALILLVVGLLAVRIFRTIILIRLKKWSLKTQTTLDDFAVEMVEKVVVPLLYFGVVYVSLQRLNLHSSLEKGIHGLWLALLTYSGARLLIAFIQYSFETYGLTKGKEEERERHFQTLFPIVKGLVWLVALLFYLENLGYQITMLMTGLGISGVALALASQAILADLFSYFVILFDHPFELDDFIVLDNDYMGSIEHIGIKSTRLRSLGGEELIICNKDLTNSRVRNYKRMQLRRVIFKLGVVYQTSSEQIRQIPGLIKTIILNVPDTRFDRAHFSAFGNSSLDFEVVYYVLSNDYNKYMDVQQTINWALFEEFQKRRIDFAYPTQTLYMTQGK